MSKYIVVDSAAKMPTTCWGTYWRVAVLDLSDDCSPGRMSIDTRRRGVLRIVRTWERLNVGKTDRCAYARALVEAKNLAGILNNVNK